VQSQGGSIWWSELWRPGDVNAFEDILKNSEIRVLRKSVDHLFNTFRTERVLGIDVDDAIRAGLRSLLQAS